MHRNTRQHLPPGGPHQYAAFYEDEYGQQSSRDIDTEFMGEDQYQQPPAERATAQRQYSSIGRGPPPAHCRSMSRSLVPPSNTQSLRPRSAHASGAYGIPAWDNDSHSRAPDLASMFEMLSLQQEQMVQQLDQNRKLIEQTQELRAENKELQARVSLLESDQASGASTDSHRGLPSTHARVKKRALARQPTAISSISDATTTTTTSTEPSSDGEDSPSPPGSTQLEKKEKTLLQKLTTQTFRQVCDVKAKDSWPNPDVVRTDAITGEIYLTPFFDVDVTDTRNQNIFQQVAKQLDEELKSSRPSALSKSATWDLDLLVGMAKESFRNFRRQWKEQNDAEAACRAAVNKHNLRCIIKLAHMKGQVASCADKIGLKPETLQVILHEQHLSDEPSGPEDEAEETKDAWKVRMAIKHGFVDVSPAAMRKRHFLEVLECGWRSDEYTIPFHGLQDQYEESLTTRDQGNIRYIRVTGTNRKGHRIPNLAPYSIGISQEWLTTAKANPEYEHLLSDWGKYNDIPGVIPPTSANEDDRTVDNTESGDDGTERSNNAPVSVGA
ncbi:hypothetical protein B0H10DRAFT_2230644 [Mycena sp. CBHHK59/15]|nr:hypothetical protein B0H10DRAFT_2230644 [Mycena sp. CBHHK59/15]